MHIYFYFFYNMLLTYITCVCLYYICLYIRTYIYVYMYVCTILFTTFFVLKKSFKNHTQSLAFFLFSLIFFFDILQINSKEEPSKIF